MGVAPDGDLGKMDEGDITPVPVDGVPPQPSHFETHPPAVLGRQLRRPGGNVVAVEDDDRDPRQFLKSDNGTGTPLSVSKALGMSGGTSPTGNMKLLPLPSFVAAAVY